MNSRSTRNMPKTELSGLHVVSTSRPPGRVTRASSAAAASGWLANITP